MLSDEESGACGLLTGWYGHTPLTWSLVSAQIKMTCKKRQGIARYDRQLSLTCTEDDTHVGALGEEISAPSEWKSRGTIKGLLKKARRRGSNTKIDGTSWTIGSPSIVAGDVGDLGSVEGLPSETRQVNLRVGPRRWSVLNVDVRKWAQRNSLKCSARKGNRLCSVRGRRSHSWQAGQRRKLWRRGAGRRERGGGPCLGRQNSDRPTVLEEFLHVDGGMPRGNAWSGSRSNVGPKGGDKAVRRKKVKVKTRDEGSL